MDTQMDEYMGRWKGERENGQTAKEISGRREGFTLGKKRKAGREDRQAELR